MTTVKLNGVEYSMAMNWRAAINYERATGENALDPKNFANGMMTSLFQLAHAMLTACNRDKDVPDFDTMLDLLGNSEDDAHFVTAIWDEYYRFIKPAPGDETEQPANDKQGSKKA